MLLVSSMTQAEVIDSIKIFHTNTDPVIQDVSFNSTPYIDVFNMDTKDNATAKLNKLVKQKITSTVTADNHVLVYKKAFDEMLNSADWNEIYKGLELGSKAIEYAIRYKVKKTPAIVFNDSTVIYGVTSLGEAVSIYNAKGELK